MSEPVSNTPEKVAEDLFDLPVEALNLPGMDAINTAASQAAFEQAEPEIAALAREVTPPAKLPKSATATATFEPAPRLRRVWIAFGALALGNVIVLALALYGNSPTAPQAAEVAPPPAPETETPPVAKTKTAQELPVPAASNGGRARLQAVESELAAGHRAIARVELGRFLLALDALPANEREDLRAEAELLVARTLQDTADEARRSSR